MKGKMIVFITGLALISFTGLAQNNSEAGHEQVIEGGQGGTMDELPLKPFRMPSLSDVGGTPFLTEEFVDGTVELGQGRVVNHVQLKFNAFNNNFLVLKDGEQLKLDFFELVTYARMDNRGVLKQYVFKAGYPAIDNQGENSIYQVISMGPQAHFLKYTAQKVEEVPTLGDYSRREIVTTEHYYVYVPGGNMTKIKSMKASRQSLKEALPSLASKIDEIATAKNLKLKSESDISILIESLNTP